MDGFDQAVEQFRVALAAFVKGDAEPATRMFSQRDDVVLCNPFHPFARGPREVAAAATEAASHFAGGDVEFETMATFTTAELGYIVQVERFRATIDGDEGRSGAVRVTMIFRLEGDGWRVAHRHADPMTMPRAIESILSN